MHRTMSIPRGADGYYHPTSEAEIVALVQAARSQQLPLRVRGSAHSEPKAIFTAGFDGEGPPPASTITLMLDRYRGITFHSDASGTIVEVDAGCHLGKDPYDPTKTSTWSNSLNVALQKRGFALSDLGGISHQTVSGFLSTGSSGGSLRYSVHDDIVRFRFVDGTGTLHDVSRDDADPSKRELFEAVGVSMGLLGVLTKVFFRVVPSYAVAGQQITTPTAEASIDFFGDKPERPAFEEYLRGASYSRLMWWPQADFDRMVVWQASRAENAPGFQAQPYQELGDAPRVAALAGSLFYTIIGNLDDVTVVPAKLADWYEALDETLENDPDPNACKAVAAGPRGKVDLADVIAYLDRSFRRATRKHPKLGGSGGDLSSFLGGLFGLVKPEYGGVAEDIVAGIITELVKLILDGALDNPIAKELARFLSREMPYIIDEILGPFVADGSLWFQDTWMCGLPMDNQMDDRLWPTVFTELWVPIEKSTEVMTALRDFYAGGGDRAVAYEHTGAFSCEIYAAKKSPFWLSPSYGTDVLRIDVFWFGRNAGDPADAFYPQFWSLLEKYGFRPHWGKVLPTPSSKWIAHYDAQLPKLAEFRKLRAAHDPDGIFLTPYWKAHLGL